MVSASSIELIKEDGDSLQTEYGGGVAVEFVLLDSFPTTVRLIADVLRAPSDQTAVDTIAINDTGGASDGDDVLIEGYTVAAATMGRFGEGAVFPRDVGRGISGGPSFNTIIQETADGGEFRISRWQRPKRRYNIATAVDTPDDFRKVMSFYRRLRGSRDGFRLRDPFDWSTHPNHMTEPDPTNYLHRQLLGAGDGTTTDYYLCKRYRCGAGSWSGGHTLERVRPITRPTHIASENHVLAVFVDGVMKTGGVHYTVDRAGGRVTFGSSPAKGSQVEWCGTFDVPVRFDQEVDQGMLAEMRTTDYYGLDLTATEISDGEHFSDHRWMGGVHTVSTADDISIYIGAGSLWRISATASNLKVYLPHTSHLLDGGPHLTIYNNDSTTFDIHDGQSPFTRRVTNLAAGEHATFYMMSDGVFLPIT